MRLRKVIKPVINDNPKFKPVIKEPVDESEKESIKLIKNEFEYRKQNKANPKRIITDREQQLSHQTGK